jgi:hypothetical protein
MLVLKPDETKQARVNVRRTRYQDDQLPSALYPRAGVNSSLDETVKMAIDHRVAPQWCHK